MNIELKNIALIEEGDLELKGITLIADENDSGKSTIGKTLFTTLTTLNSFEKEFLTNLSQRIEVSYFSLKSISEESLDNNEIKIINQSILKRITELSKKIDSFDQEINKIIKSSLKMEISEKNFKNLEILFSMLIEDTEILKNDLKNYIEQKNLNLTSDNQFLIYRLITSLDELLNLKPVLNYEKIKLDLFQRAFYREFENNISNIFLDEKKSFIGLNESGEKIEIGINDSRISHVNFMYGKLKRENNTIYVESPLIIDYIEEICRRGPLSFINKIDKNYRIKKLKSALQNEREIDEVDTVLGKEELYKDLLERIHKIILGEFEYNKSNKDFIYRKQGYAFDKKNVATGIKSFGIIEILLKNKQLDENTILIIDEPEVHLHPNWQIKYVEILILISKELGVKILLNSHSPYLIRALEVYRKTYNYEDNIKFYTLTDCTEGKSKKIVDVTNNLNKIFDKLIEPYEILREVDERYSDDE